MKIKKIKKVFPNQKIARYNLAVWKKKESDSVYFIGREVSKAGLFGQPDTGVLKMFEINSNGNVVHERIIWEPSYDGISLEDPRVMEFPKENLAIGLTAVLRDKNGTPKPFPAIINIDSHSTWNKELPPFLIISIFGSGKNVTPLAKSIYLFRPDDHYYDHKLLVFSTNHPIPKKIGVINLPDNLSWAKYKIGTAMPPIWFNKNEALFIVHGITKRKINGHLKYIYSLGRAKLTRKGNTFKVIVAKDPILTPDNFLDKDGVPLVKELHPRLRRVVYSCGGLIKKSKKDTLSLYVNVGDRTTFEVEFSLEELKQGLFNN